MKRFICVLLVVVMCMMTFAGCGKSANVEDGEDTAEVDIEKCRTTAELCGEGRVTQEEYDARIKAQRELEKYEEYDIDNSPFFYIPEEELYTEDGYYTAKYFTEPQMDLPGIDMTPYVGSVVTIMGEDFYVIRVSELNPSLALCLLILPGERSNKLPIVVTDEDPEQFDDHISYCGHWADVDENGTWHYETQREFTNTDYIGSNAQKIADAWAEQSPLKDYMLEKEFGIGDLYERLDDGKFIYHLYTDSLWKKAYIASVEELSDIYMPNFARYDAHVDFWTRTPYNSPLGNADEQVGDMTTFSNYPNDYNDAYFAKRDTTYYFWLLSVINRDYCRPAIVCNLYNLTEDMVEVNYELSSESFTHTFDMYFLDENGNYVPDVEYALSTTEGAAYQSSKSLGHTYIHEETAMRREDGSFKWKIYILSVPEEYEYLGETEIDAGIGGTFEFHFKHK